MKNTDKYYVIVYLYINDMLILDSNDHMIKSNKKMSSYQLNKFDIKNLSTIDVKLWIIFLKHLIDYYYSNLIMLRMFLTNFLNNIIRISMDIRVYLLKYQGEKIDQLKYCRIIKNLMYVINWIRFYIAYLVSKPSKFLSNPTIDH